MPFKRLFCSACMYCDVGGAAACMPNRAARGIKQKIDYISMETDYLDGDMSNIVNIMLYTLPR